MREYTHTFTRKVVARDTYAREVPRLIVDECGEPELTEPRRGMMAGFIRIS